MNVSYHVVQYVTNEQIVFQVLCRCAVIRTWNTPFIYLSLESVLQIFI